MGKSVRFLFALLLAVSATAWGQLTETVVVTSQTSVAPSPANNWTDILVTCPAGLSAISGGVDTSFFNAIEVGTLAPTFDGAALAFVTTGTHAAPDGWYASVRNFDSVSHPVSLSAVCAALPGVISTVAASVVSGGSVATPGSGGVVALCQDGYAALGGGVDLSSASSMKVSSTAPVFGFEYLIDRPAGLGGAPTGWGGNARNEGDAGTIKVAATCAPLGGVFSVVTAAFTIGSGAVSGLSAQCPAGSLVLGGGIDTNDVTKNALAVSTPLFPANPQFPVDRPTGTYSSASAWYGIFFNYGPATSTAKVGVICAQPTPNVEVVYEFYNTELQHYFRTATAEEAAAIDRGASGPGWIRTGDNFYAYVAGSASPGFDVCRFYTFGANSHFYTAFASECAALKSPFSGWNYEELSFRIQLPAQSGACPAGTKSVYRLYNNRFAFNDSNHRFTTLASEVTRLQGLGWTYEGVAFCALNL